MLLFHEEWFRFTLGQLVLSIQDKALEDVTKALKEDEELRDLSCLISLGAVCLYQPQLCLQGLL